MWEYVFQAAVSSGIWAALFCALLVYQLKDSRKRECNYQATIERLSKSLEGISRGLEAINRGLEGVFEVRGIVGEILNKIDDVPVKRRTAGSKRRMKVGAVRHCESAQITLR